MAFAYTAGLQGRIALAVWNVPYASLTANQKTQLDNTWSSGAITGGEALAAWTEVAQIGQWFEQAVSNPDTSFPQPAWDRLFVAKCAMYLSKTVRPDRLAEFQRDHEVALDEAIDTYTPTLITAAAISGQALTVAGIRAYVCNHCVRRKESGANQGLRRRIFPPIQDVDSHSQWTCNFLWNKELWNFRKRMIQITINANNTVTMTGLSGETFDSIASNRFYYDGNNFGSVLEWVDSTTAPGLKAYHGTSQGTPRYFRTETKGSTVSWHLFPIPDQAYTLYGTVYVATPTMTTMADIDSAIGRFPPEFGTVIRDIVLARVLMAHQASDGQRMWDLAMEQVEILCPTYTETGSPARLTSVLDVYSDHSLLRGDEPTGAFGYGY